MLESRDPYLRSAFEEVAARLQLFFAFNSRSQRLYGASRYTLCIARSAVDANSRCSTMKFRSRTQRILAGHKIERCRQSAALELLKLLQHLRVDHTIVWNAQQLSGSLSCLFREREEKLCE